MKALVLVALAALAAANPEDPDTVVLTSKNFDEFIASEQAVLVEFYAPWCGHCKRLAPEYAKAATILKAQGIQIGKLDATEEGDIASKFGIQGYPTLKVFRGGKASDYNGPRESAGIIAYMRKEAAPAFVEFKTMAEAVAHGTKLNQPVIVGTFADEAAAKPFLTVTSAAREHLFGVIYGGEQSVQIIFPESPRYAAAVPSTFTGEIDVAALSKWALSASLPAAGVSDGISEAIYAAATVPVVTLYVPSFDPAKDPAGTKYFINRLKKIAPAYTGKAVFAISDAAKAPFETHSGVAYTLGAVVDGVKYRHPTAPSKGFDKDGVVAFTDGLLAGSLEPFMKSEPIPETQGNVKVLVAKNFKAETDGKGGLIEFYAPWCGHCKSLAPVWDKLGDTVAAKAPEVLIAKMDATANDVPAGFDVTGFPTIYYVTADGQKTKYQGGRELKDFTKFLKEKKLM